MTQDELDQTLDLFKAQFGDKPRHVPALTGKDDSRLTDRQTNSEGRNTTVTLCEHLDNFRTCCSSPSASAYTSTAAVLSCLPLLFDRQSDNFSKNLHS